MFDFCICDYNDCEKANNCFRYLNKNSSNPVTIRFKNICHQENNYQWYWQAPEELIVKVEKLEEKVEIIEEVLEEKEEVEGDT